METIDRNTIENQVKLWYQRRASQNKIPVWYANNHIIDLPTLDDEILTYYYTHSNDDSTTHTTSENALCCNTGDLCVHRYEYYGCAGCHVKIESDKMRHTEES